MGQSAGKYIELGDNVELEPEPEPKCVVEDANALPYDVLVRLGVIVQRARLDGNLVERTDDGEWMHRSKRTGKTTLVEKDAEVDAKLWDRHDVQPGYVIRVVGNLDYEEFVTSAKQRRGLEKRRIIEEMKRVPGVAERLGALAADPTSVSFAAPNRDESEGGGKRVPNLGIFGAGFPGSAVFGAQATEPTQEHLEDDDALVQGTGYEGLNESDTESVVLEELPPPTTREDEYSEWLDGLKKHQIARFIKQYLSRSIPAAAKELNALVVVSDTVRSTRDGDVVLSDVSATLNRGMYNARARAEQKDSQLGIKASGVKKSEFFVCKPLLVGVHVWEEEEPSPDDPDQPVTQAPQAQTIRESINELGKRLSAYDAHVFLTEERQFKRGTVTHASQAKVHSFLSGMTACLEQGNVRTSYNPLPFRQRSNGTAYVLVGGDKKKKEQLEMIKVEVQQACKRGMKVLVIEGSGGYADVLCSTISQVEEMCGKQFGDYRSCLGALSPRTSQIISSGCLEVVAKGTNTEAFQSVLQKAVVEDSTLYNAWRKYATWEYNANYCRQVFLYQQMLVLGLGVLTIGLSIVQTFIQLQYPEEISTTKGQEDPGLVKSIYTWLGLVIVVLPVGLSLVEAIENRMNCGGRWVMLRSVSETLLREIYMYRTRSKQYSDTAIRKSEATAELARKQRKFREEAAAAAAEEEEAEEDEEDEEQKTNRLDRKIREHMNATDETAYNSRQEKLGMWITHLTDQLKDSDCQNASLYTYCGPLPPAHLGESGDDGWGYLTPDLYLEHRLHPLMCRYRAAAKYYERKIHVFTITNYVIGTLGTLCAALSSVPTLDSYNLQAWVAFTTGVSNALTRYMDYSRMEFLGKKSNKVKMELSGVQSWWDSRGKDAESQDTVDELVHKTEGLVTGELIEWSGQMKKALDKSKKDKTGDDGRDDKRQALEEEDKKVVLKDLGLADITADSLAAAFEDPKGHAASHVLESMKRLTNYMEERVDAGPDGEKLARLVQAEHETELEKLRSVAEEYLDDTGNLLNINLAGVALSDYVPVEISSQLQNVKERRKMFRDIAKLNPHMLTRTGCLELFSGVSAGLRQKMAELSQRQMLECLKFAVVEQLQEDLVAGLRKFNVGVYDLVPRDGMIEILLMELKDLGKSDWRTKESAEIVAKIKDEDIQKGIERLNEVALRGLLKRADKLFKGKTAMLLAALVTKIASLDVEELFHTPQLKAEVYATIEQIDGHAGDAVGVAAASLLTRETLLARLPPQVRTLAHVVNKTQAQLAEYMNIVSSGFCASRIFKEFEREYNKKAAGRDDDELDRAVGSVLKAILENKRLTDRFVFSMKSISQLEINRYDKKMLLRELSMSPALAADMIDDLKFLNEKLLKEVMSGLKLAIATSYQASVFDKLCDTLTRFDLRNMLADAEDREKFIDQMREFKGVDVPAASRQELLTTLAYRSLVLKFLKLSRVQIVEIVQHSKNLMGNPFVSAIFVTALNMTEGQPLSLEDQDDLARVDDEAVHRLVVGLMRHEPEALEVTLNKERQGMISEMELGGLFYNHSVALTTLGWTVERRAKIFLETRRLLDEGVLVNVFSEAAGAIPTGIGAVTTFVHLFARSEARLFILECLTFLLDTPFEKIAALHNDPAELIRMMSGVSGTGVARSKHSEGRREILTMMQNVFDTRVGKHRHGITFHTIMLHLLNEIIMHTPYMLFLKACTDPSAGFDLRELVDEPRTRRLFPVVLLLCNLGGSFQGHNLKNLGARQVLNACTDLMHYENVVNDLRLLTEEQMGWFTRVVIQFFEDEPVGKPVGNFFKKYLRLQASADTGDAVDYHVLVEAYTSVRNHVQSNPEEVLREFKQFDPDHFFSILTEDEKARVLQKYIADDDTARTIASYGNTQLRRLFAHITAVPCIKSAQVQRGAGLTTDMKTAYQKAESGLKQKVDEVTEKIEKYMSSRRR